MTQGAWRKHSQQESNLWATATMHWFLVQKIHNWTTEDLWELQSLNLVHVTNILFLARTGILMCLCTLIEKWWRILSLVKMWERCFINPWHGWLVRDTASTPRIVKRENSINPKWAEQIQLSSKQIEFSFYCGKETEQWRKSSGISLVS